MIPILKKSKHILTRLNLILFLGSFVMLTLAGLSANDSSQAPDHIPHHFTSKQDGLANGASQQLSEKNETETENDLELEALALPFFVASYLQVIISEPVIPTAQPLAEKTSHPIYVAVRNFRI